MVQKVQKREYFLKAGKKCLKMPLPPSWSRLADDKKIPRNSTKDEANRSGRDSSGKETF
jgi:hypothetical protein